MKQQRRKTSSYRPKLMSRAYQPKGSAKAPVKVAQLVSGVLSPTHNNIKIEIVNKKNKTY